MQIVFTSDLRFALRLCPKMRSLLPIVHSGHSVMYIRMSHSLSASRLACHTAVPDPPTLLPPGGRVIPSAVGDVY